MSRMNAGGPILVKAQNNVYTALAGAALLAVLAAIVVLVQKHSEFDFKILAPIM